jgi:hypothetical protein
VIGETGPGDYRVGYGATPPNLTLSLSETIATGESHGGYTHDPDHLAIYSYEDILTRDVTTLPILLTMFEAISVVEFLRIGRNLAIRRHETITVREMARLYVPMKILLVAYEEISLVDRVTWGSPALFIRAHEAIAVTEGPANGGANGNTLVVGPAPAPLVVPDDYWVVGV